MISVLGKTYGDDDFLEVDLSVNNNDLKQLSSQLLFTDYIHAQIEQADKRVAVGGYLEERDFYLDSELFSNDQRTIHLGIDVWLSPATPIYMPIDGIVIANANNNKYLDYGYTIITQHRYQGNTIHCLFGHLSKTAFQKWKIGDHVSAGSVLCYIGGPDENGGWAPHLHLQLINELEQGAIDYPGVCHKTDIDFYKQNCPNPIHWIIQ